MDVPATLWGAVVLAVGVILAARTDRHHYRARHLMRWWTPLHRWSMTILASALTERHPRDEWGRWLIPIEGEPRDRG